MQRGSVDGDTAQSSRNRSGYPCFGRYSGTMLPVVLAVPAPRAVIDRGAYRRVQRAQRAQPPREAGGFQACGVVELVVVQRHHERGQACPAENITMSEKRNNRWREHAFSGGPQRRAAKVRFAQQITL